MAFKGTEMQMIIGNAKILFTTEIKASGIICGYFHFYEKCTFWMRYSYSNLDKKKEIKKKKEKCQTSDFKTVKH